jgi:hypothetical protein
VRTSLGCCELRPGCCLQHCVFPTLVADALSLSCTQVLGSIVRLRCGHLLSPRLLCWVRLAGVVLRNTPPGSVTSVMYTIPFGFSVAICTLSGNLLGAGDIASAKRVVRVGMTLAFSVSIVLACVVLAASSVIPRVRCRFTCCSSVCARAPLSFARAGGCTHCRFSRRRTVSCTGQPSCSVASFAFMWWLRAYSACAKVCSVAPGNR